MKTGLTNDLFSGYQVKGIFPYPSEGRTADELSALPEALAHATPTQVRRVRAYYIAGIKQPEIARREGIHSSKVSVAIHRGLRNMRRCYDGLFQTE